SHCRAFPSFPPAYFTRTNHPLRCFSSSAPSIPFLFRVDARRIGIFGCREPDLEDRSTTRSSTTPTSCSTSA
uniref:Uncharacterized protein n=1 Tax=Aegilops tauschii subsp. strangulata TaxID=200361 RepID=A0A453GF37_AEGTS